MKYLYPSVLLVTSIGLLRVHGIAGPLPSRPHSCSVKAPRTVLASQTRRSTESKDPFEAMERTKLQLQKLKQLNSQYAQTINSNDPSAPVDPLSRQRDERIRQYIQLPAQTLKTQLQDRGLPSKGRKPDLAYRLAQDDLREQFGLSLKQDEYEGEEEDNDGILLDSELFIGSASSSSSTANSQKPAIATQFAGMTSLSPVAQRALAGFHPTPIQAAALPRLQQGGSMILHAPTGSGKTLAYLLPMTEHAWQQNDDDAIYLVLTPTRELAAQVAAVASALAPPGTVRLVARPTHLLRPKDLRESNSGETNSDATIPSIVVGSAKAILHSLYGDGKMPASPTPKPQAMEFLKRVQYIVLDEVDRLLGVKKTKGEKKQSKNSKTHERPAAVVTAAVARLSLGRAQVVAASATVGRPLRREFSRVLGLEPSECPPVVRGDDAVDVDDQEETDATATVTTGRRVTIPDTVENYILAVDSASPGDLLTKAYQVIESLTGSTDDNMGMLLVLTRGFGINTQNAVGALRHFGCQPEPQSLLDALQSTNDEDGGTDHLIRQYEQVAGTAGVGTSAYFEEERKSSSYLWVTGEDTVRGLHLDGLDVVFVLGRAHGPDEYTHIAGRTGRAGRSGKVINIVSKAEAVALASWENMLDTTFVAYTHEKIMKS